MAKIMKYGFDIVRINLIGVEIPLVINYYDSIVVALSLYIANALLYFYGIINPGYFNPLDLQIIEWVFYLPFISLLIGIIFFMMIIKS